MKILGENGPIGVRSVDIFIHIEIGSNVNHILEEER